MDFRPQIIRVTKVPEFEASTFNAVFGRNVPESDYFDYLPAQRARWCMQELPCFWISVVPAFITQHHADPDRVDDAHS